MAYGSDGSGDTAAARLQTINPGRKRKGSAVKKGIKVKSPASTSKGGDRKGHVKGTVKAMKKGC